MAQKKQRSVRRTINLGKLLGSTLFTSGRFKSDEAARQEGNILRAELADLVAARANLESAVATANDMTEIAGERLVNYTRVSKDLARSRRVGGVWVTVALLGWALFYASLLWS